MTDLTDPSGASLRLSNDERERAVAALQSHAAAGRLDDAELQSRVASARAAVTRGDLAPLFADLPGTLHLDDHATTSPSPASAQPGASTPPSPPAASFAPAPPAAPADPYGDDRYRPNNRWGLLVVSVMPFIAVILFFVTSGIWGYQYSWLWFLLIPLAGALVYGVDGPRRR
ncbi:DUF1707 domain-containing protein [Leifsonia sp. ZF2019]|uniref:DUF1707 SHOCT-like domain-containing protein n=1 Tax=Leifsonia sp. ZF2019 TaxID=2781978 RepID=UPI001CC1ABB1|nr:DUF1707 domain-containing protein [Leifsonia sp. ZF2019]UAJ77847.1 DUF1707 domain-containing protein [Leifsonia sp. ZF2019]